MLLSLGAVLAIVGLVLTGMSFTGDDPKINPGFIFATSLLVLGAIMLRDDKKQPNDEKKPNA